MSYAMHETDELHELREEVKRLKAALASARFDVDAAKAEAGSVRMCLNCGKTVPASHPRHEALHECIGPEGLSACTFDVTPHEAWQIWRDRYYELSSSAQAAREEGRKQGLEDAARVAEQAPYKRGGIICGCSEGLSEWTANAIRAMKEKQP